MSDQDLLIFSDPEEDNASARKPLHNWRVLIVDDEEEVHTVTRLALDGLKFRGRSLELISAFSGKEAVNTLRANPDIALVFMDVIMENDQAGLECVRQIREVLKNRFIRIILRTGQPGQAPEHDVIINYDINDYKSKTELTVSKLFTAVITALRTYEDLMSLEYNRQGLEKIIRSFSEIFEIRSLEAFVAGVLIQVDALLKLDTNMVFDSTFISLSNKIIATTGDFEQYNGMQLREVLAKEVNEKIAALDSGKQAVQGDDYIAFCVKEGTELVSMIFLQGAKFDSGVFLSDQDQKLVEDFLDNITVAYRNIYNRKNPQATNVAFK